MSISSWARSTTASATRFFRFSQVDDADLRQRRLGLAAADVFLHQVDLGDRHVELGPLGEFEEQRLLGMLGRLVDEVQAAIAGDPVVDVDDQVALIQVEEAVDRPAFVPPARDRPADLGAGEQLVVADHERLGVDQVEAGPDPADGQMQPARSGQLGVGKDLAQPLDLGLVVAGDQDVLARGRAVELGLDLGQLAREPLDALDPQVAGRLERVGRQRRDRDRRQADQPLEAALDREQPALVVEPAEVMAPLLAEVGRLEQGDPGSLRENNRPDGRSSPRSASSKPRAAVSVTEVQRSSERWDSTSNGRIDSTSSPKNSMRTGSVASVGKTSRMPPRTLNSPGTSTTSARAIPRSSSQAVRLFDRHRRRRRPRCATSGPATRASAPAEASPETARPRAGAGSRSRSLLSTRIRRPKTSSAAFSSRGSFSQAGKTSGTIPAKVATSSRKSSTSPTWASTITSVAGACSPSAAAASAGGRAPGAVDRRAAAVLERRQQPRETRRALDLPRQVLEPPDR